MDMDETVLRVFPPFPAIDQMELVTVGIYSEYAP